MRLAEPTDCERLEYMEGVLFPDNAFNALTLQKELRIGRCWVVERTRTIIAYLLARIESSVLDVMRVGVMPSFQSRGIGTRLLEAAMSQTLQTILCVRKDNLGAIRLYQRMGFHIVGETGQGELCSWVMSTSAEKRTGALPDKRGSSVR